MEILRILIMYKTLEKAKKSWETNSRENKTKKEWKIRTETAKESKKLTQLSIKVQCRQTWEYQVQKEDINQEMRQTQEKNF